MLQSGAMAQTEPEAVRVTGQMRWRAETRNDADFNSSLDDHAGFILQRLRINLEKRLASRMRIFVQLQDSRTWGEEGSTTGVLDAIDLHRAHLEIERVADLPITVSLGRQILAYGNQGLVGALDWNNVGRSYNALRLRVGDNTP